MATALDIIASVRDLVPDPSYDTTGTPQPDTDQAVRQQELVRWLNNAQRLVSRKCKCVEEWTAVPSVANQDSYPVDPRFWAVSDVYYDGWALDYAETPDFFYRGVVSGGPAWNYAVNEKGKQLSISLWPFGLRTPGASTATNPIDPADTSLTVGSAANFGASGGPSLGFLWLDGGTGIGQLGSELVSYRAVNTTTGVFSTLQRGRGGTTPLTHKPGAEVVEANIWIHGWRIARPISLQFSSAALGVPATTPRSDPGFVQPSWPIGMTDPLDIPDSMSYLLETYLLSKVREKENDRNEAKSLMDQFNAELKDISEDPQLMYGQAQGHQVRVGRGGGLAFGRIIVP